METNAKNDEIKNGAYIALVERINNEKNKPLKLYKGTVESMLYEFFSKTSKKKYTWKRETFKQLLVHLHNQKCYALLRKYNKVKVLHNISSNGNLIVRNIEDWKRDSRDEDQQISSLIKHCFALYKTPEFLETSFYGVDKKEMLWYIQLGRGKSVKDLSQMPITLTSKMAHEFRNAHDFYSVGEALRYAQAKGFGASTQNAQLIAFSRLSMINDSQEAFWATVVQFFSKEENLNVNQLDGIVDYLGFKYRENPSFSMKNRTFSALVNQTEVWHREVYMQKKGEVLSWNASGIKPLYFQEVVDNKKVVYRTKELLNSQELYDEGNAMQHCVSSYDEDCNEGRSTIFSLVKEVGGEPAKRLVTVEVELPSYEIVQVKAKCNQEPDKKSREMINHWVNNSQVKNRGEIEYQRQYQPQQIVQQQVHARTFEARQEPIFSKDTLHIIWVIIKLLLLIAKAMSM